MNESKVRENVREAATFNPRKPNATRALKDDIAESQKPREKMVSISAMADRSVCGWFDEELAVSMFSASFAESPVLSS